MAGSDHILFVPALGSSTSAARSRRPHGCRCSTHASGKLAPHKLRALRPDSAGRSNGLPKRVPDRHVASTRLRVRAGGAASRTRGEGCSRGLGGAQRVRGVARPGCRMATENGADVLHIGGHGTLTCGCAPSRPIRRTALEGGSQASHSVARSAASTVSTRAIHLRIMAALRSGSLSALPASGGPVWHARTRMHAHARTHAHTGAHARARARTRASSCAHTHRAVRRLAPATFEDQIPL
jgi:hypothetical protein